MKKHIEYIHWNVKNQLVIQIPFTRKLRYNMTAL